MLDRWRDRERVEERESKSNKSASILSITIGPNRPIQALSPHQHFLPSLNPPPPTTPPHPSLTPPPFTLHSPPSFTVHSPLPPFFTLHYPRPLHPLMFIPLSSWLSLHCNIYTTMLLVIYLF